MQYTLACAVRQHARHAAPGPCCTGASSRVECRMPCGKGAAAGAADARSTGALMANGLEGALMPWKEASPLLLLRCSEHSCFPSRLLQARHGTARAMVGGGDRRAARGLAGRLLQAPVNKAPLSPPSLLRTFHFARTHVPSAHVPSLHAPVK